MDKKPTYIIVGDNNYWYATVEGSLTDIVKEVKYIKNSLSDYPAPVPEKLYIYKATLVKEEVCHV